MSYFEVKAFSASAIKAGAKSMLHMADFLENGKEPSSAMAKGSLLHLALLEHEKLDAMACIGYDGRTKAGKELVEAYGKENIIKPKEKEQLQQAAKMVLSHPEVLRLNLFKGGEAEKEIYWNNEGVDCKCKIDYDQPDCIVEYKSTQNLQRFSVAAASMFYHLQLGWYWHGAGRKPVYIVAQESKRPFDVMVCEVSPLLLRTWYDDAWKIVQRYISGERSGAFPLLLNFELPAWAIGADVDHNENEEIQF